MNTCDVPRDLFLKEKPELRFAKPYTLTVKPKQLGSKFGWQGSKPNQVVHVKVAGNDIVAHVMTSCTMQLSGNTKCSLTADEFLKSAKDLDVSDIVSGAEAREFQTGSLGWNSHQQKTIKVGAEDLLVTVNFNATLKGSKPADGEARPQEHECGDSAAPAKRPHPVDDADGAGKRLRLEDAPATPCTSSGDFTALFFPGPGSFEKLLDVLQEASKTLDVAVYLLTENRLAGVLLDKHRAGVGVRVITDNDMSHHFKTSDIDELVAAGIEVREDRTNFHMHHKFAVVDGRTCINGSFNWTTPSAEGRNLENLVVCRRADVAARFAARFETLWTAFNPDRSGPSPPAATAPRDGNCQVLFYPDTADGNFHIFVKALQNAKVSLEVAVFMLTVREALDAMKEAHGRGVRVRVLTDNNSARTHGGDHVKELRAAGIVVRTDKSQYNMHHKFAVIDEDTVITGSFNWTRQAEEGNNEDCMVLQAEPDLAKAYTHEFNRLWSEFA